MSRRRRRLALAALFVSTDTHGDSLQMEDASFFLLEDGSRILLESA